MPSLLDILTMLVLLLVMDMDTTDKMMVTVEAAVVRIARSPQEEEGNPFWWCDPEQAGYAFILNPGVKAWCEENAA